MARIQVYPLDGDLDGADMLVGTDGTPGVDLNKTKNFTLSDLKNYINSYEIYFIKSMVVDGVIEEVLNTYENTIGDIVVSAGPSGSTTLTLNGAFTNINKIVIFCNGEPTSPILTHDDNHINVPTTAFIELRIYK